MKSLIDKGLVSKAYYKELGARADLLEAEKLYGAFTRAVDNVSPFFVLSFCKHADDSYEYQNGLLSQWRGYAENGGFAIEFDESELDLLAKLENDKFAYAGFKSESVEYNEHEKLFDPADYAGLAGAMIRDVFDELGKDISDVAGKKNVDEAVLKFAQTAPFLKHRGFYEEAEYRIVFVCLRASKIPEGEERRAKPIKFRQTSGLLIPFIELFDTVHERPFPIKGIIVGPHPLQEKQEESVKMLLEAEDLVASVRSSQIPYRRQ